MYRVCVFPPPSPSPPPPCKLLGNISHLRFNLSVCYNQNEHVCPQWIDNSLNKQKHIATHCVFLLKDTHITHFTWMYTNVHMYTCTRTHRGPEMSIQHMYTHNLHTHTRARVHTQDIHVCPHTLGPIQGWCINASMMSTCPHRVRTAVCTVHTRPYITRVLNL